MCQAIVKPQAMRANKDMLRKAWIANADGAGFAFLEPNDGKVYFQKGFFKFKKFWKAYVKHEKKDVLIHFRFATHGDETQDNCHPFVVGTNAVMAHNGIFAGFAPEPKRSDTKIFVEDFLAPIIKDSGLTPSAFITQPGMLPILEKLIGTYNKVAFLTEKGFTILNEKAGEWVDGVWYSSGDPRYQVSLYDLSTSNLSPYGLSKKYSIDWPDTSAGDEKVMLEWEREVVARDYALEKVKESDNTPSPKWEKQKCVYCEKPSAKLYQVGADMLCSECWNESYSNYSPSRSLIEGD